MRKSSLKDDVKSLISHYGLEESSLGILLQMEDTQLVESCPQHVREIWRQSSDMKGNGSMLKLLFLKKRGMLFPSLPPFHSAEESQKYTRYNQGAQ